MLSVQCTPSENRGVVPIVGDSSRDTIKLQIIVKFTRNLKDTDRVHLGILHTRGCKRLLSTEVIENIEEGRRLSQGAGTPTRANEGNLVVGEGADESLPGIHKPVRVLHHNGPLHHPAIPAIIRLPFPGQAAGPPASAFPQTAGRLKRRQGFFAGNT